MKKILLVLALGLGSLNANALIDVGVNGGLAGSSGGGSMTFAYGASAGFGLGPLFVVGPKLEIYNSTVGLNVNTGVYIPIQFKVQFAGFQVGGNLGMGIETVTAPPLAASSTTSLIYGACAAYYFGSVIKFGPEFELIKSSAANSNLLYFILAGVKISI